MAERTGRNIILWPGYCPTHIYITEDDIQQARQTYPQAIVMSHPECSAPVRDMSDELLSTGQMLKFVGKSPAKQFVVGTEKGIIHALKKIRPDAEYICPTQRAVCPNMKKIRADKVIWSLEEMQEKVTIEEPIRTKAKKALDRMVEVLPTK